MTSPEIREIRLIASYEALLNLADDLQIFAPDDSKKVLLTKQRLSEAVALHFASRQKPNILWMLHEAGSRVNYQFSIVIVQEPRYAYESGRPVEGLHCTRDLSETWRHMMMSICRCPHFAEHTLQAHLQYTTTSAGTQPKLYRIMPTPTR